MPFSYYVAPDDQLADIADALGSAINEGTTDYVALREGNQLVIVKTSTDSFVATVAVTPADDRPGEPNSGNVALTAGTTPSAATAILAGAAAEGETWTVGLGGFDYDYDVGAGETTSDIAAGLAALINFTNSLEGLVAALAVLINEEGTYSAAADGTTLTITKPGSTITASVGDASGDFSDSDEADDQVALSLAGPLADGEDWTVTLSHEVLELIVDSTLGFFLTEQNTRGSRNRVTPINRGRRAVAHPGNGQGA